MLMLSLGVGRGSVKILKMGVTDMKIYVQKLSSYGSFRQFSLNWVEKLRMRLDLSTNIHALRLGT